MADLGNQVLVWCFNLVPPVIPRDPQDVQVVNDGSGAVIKFWNVQTLGVQPTSAQLAAITQTQIDDYFRTLAKATAKTSIDLNPGYQQRAMAAMAAFGATTNGPPTASAG